VVHNRGTWSFELTGSTWIFTDNDDTKEPIVAHYGKIELLCNIE